MNQYDLCEALNEYMLGSGYRFIYIDAEKSSDETPFFRVYYFDGSPLTCSEKEFPKQLIRLPGLQLSIINAYLICLLNYQLSEHDIRIERIKTDNYYIYIKDQIVSNCKFNELEAKLEKLMDYLIQSY